MPQTGSDGTFLTNSTVNRTANRTINRTTGSLKNRYGRMTTLVFPLFALLFIIGTAALQLIILNNAQATAPVQMHGMLSPLLAESRVVGDANPRQHISLALGLRPRDMGALQGYVQEILRPGSPQYHHFLSPEQFTATFSPTQASYDVLRSYAQQAGFTITHTYTHRLLLVVSGTLEQAEKAFHVGFHTYRSAHGTIYYANDKEPVLPAFMAKEVQSVVGLNDALTWHHSLAVRQLVPPHTQAPVCPGHSNSYLTPDQVDALYHRQPLTAEHLQGEGQTLALFELAGFDMHDLSSYTACFGHARPVIQTILSGTESVPTNAGMLEAEMDAELALSALPRLSTLKIYEAANNASDVLAEWAQIVQDAPSVVSTSWGICEAQTDPAMVQQENLLFTAATAQGQSIFAASGDSGSSGCVASDGGTRLSADDPSSQPLVTGVGGTTLTLRGNTYGAEQAWNSASAAGAGASGGGISRYWTAPDWQDAPGVRNSYSTREPCHAAAGMICREAPDVALHADPHHGYLAYCTIKTADCDGQHPWVVVGGTSTAAPLWAALAVQANELSLRQGGSLLGPLNPLLYQIARNPASYASDFHDITKGHSDLKNAHEGAYPATPGYDMATGLGSYNGVNLVRDLVALSTHQKSTHAPLTGTTWYFAEGSVGGNFQQYITLSNSHPLQDSTVMLHYLFTNRAPVVVRHIVRKNSRLNVNVNGDLHMQPHDRQEAVATIVEVARGNPGVMAERSMSFTYKGIQGRTDVVGATATSLSHYFALVDTRRQGRAYYSYFSLLNPDPHKKAVATLTYYTGTCGPVWQSACPWQRIEIAPLRRSTVSPDMIALYQQMSASVESNVPLVVECTMYFKDTLAQAGGSISGATSEVGATQPETRWSFADSHTDSSQENLILANFNNVDTTAHIRLSYDNGHSQTVNVSVPGQGQMLFDVNQANSQPTGTCDTPDCQTTPSAAITVTADGPIVSQMFQFLQTEGKKVQPSVRHAMRISDMPGLERTEGKRRF